MTKREYEKLLDFAVELGVENGYMQEMESARKSISRHLMEKG